MIKHSSGNAAKTTKRCPHCGFENALAAWERLPKDERRIAHSCAACGQWIVLDHVAWESMLAKTKED